MTWNSKHSSKGDEQVKRDIGSSMEIARGLLNSINYWILFCLWTKKLLAKFFFPNFFNNNNNDCLTQVYADVTWLIQKTRNMPYFHSPYNSKNRIWGPFEIPMKTTISTENVLPNLQS